MSKPYPDNIDLKNPEFQNLWNLIQHTRKSVFLTGKAGTGKSTFLKYICANTDKKFVVLAPTGIAAVNVGGQTLHSFFQIPFKPLLPNDPDYCTADRIKRKLRFSKRKTKLIKELDLIIIDEISMVRADIIDYIDKVLRAYATPRVPFGGKQLLFVGDIFQLEPVVKRDEFDILRRYYANTFFFNARVFDLLGLIPIELRKVYRQNDGPFIALLDRMRVGETTQADLDMLNCRYRPDHATGDFTITLASRRDTVDCVNQERLDSIRSKEYTFPGEIDGDFPDNLLPTSLELTLKRDAQIIFIRNDKEGNWVNGTIAKIDDIDNDTIVVRMEDGRRFTLEPEIWSNIQYTYNERKNTVEENVLGSFTQYPIKLAWALTVHKSQGMTFNNIVIDFAGGAFAGGQTYVALSRCTSLEGITLMRTLSIRDIIVNPAVVEFSRRFNNQKQVDDAIEQERARTLYKQASLALDSGNYRQAVSLFVEANELLPTIQSPAVQRLIASRLRRLGQRRRPTDTEAR